FVGRPVILTGRFQGDANTPIRVAGKIAGGRLDFAVPVNSSDTTSAHSGLPSVWARMKIADLAEQSIYEPNAEWSAHVKHVALDYGLMSDFTAFIAVDASHITDGSDGTTVPVAVPVPEGVNYETTVPEQ